MNDSRGFTLIELLVVVAIMALIIGVAMPTISNYFQVSINSATRDLATIVKESYNSAMVTGKVYRIAYSFKENAYWVEMGPAAALLDTKESKEKEERRRKFAKSSSAKDQSQFSMDKSITRKKISLPRGVTYEDIVTQQSIEPISEGFAYTHFFPHGVTEQTIIHLQDQSKHHVSLVITPLIGMTDLYDRYINGTEAFKNP